MCWYNIKPVPTHLIYQLLSSFMAALAAEVKIESTRLNINAQKKPSIRMPSINLSAIMMINALMTKRNKPSVMMVIGRVNKISNGLIKAFNTASTRANITAVL